MMSPSVVPSFDKRTLDGMMTCILIKIVVPWGIEESNIRKFCYKKSNNKRVLGSGLQKLGVYKIDVIIFY